jgi:histone-lysine N-methyltransferase ASH1L
VFWDDESDCDLLSVLPPLEEAAAAARLPRPASRIHQQRRRKKTKKLSSRTGSTGISGLLKKTSLRAGLFSFDFKSPDEGTSSAASSPLTRLKNSLIYRPEEHPFSLLPPPYYCGRQLRQKREDFCLPYDIWAQQVSGGLPTRDVLATWNYKRIKANIYYDVRPSAAAYETPACHCRPPADRSARGCTDNCINRLTYTECDPASCPLGPERCANMAIQKHLSTVAVERFMTQEKGWGIRARSAVAAGTFIMEYLGEVVSDREFKRRMQTDYQKDTHHYCLALGEGLVIDGHRMGGECRFVNHSCQPNCEMQKWSVNGQYRMALFSTKDLAPSEELTYDYNFSLFNPHEGQECRCGMPVCRGVIGGKSQRVAPRGGGTVAAVKGAHTAGGKSARKGAASGEERRPKEKSRSTTSSVSLSPGEEVKTLSNKVKHDVAADSPDASQPTEEPSRPVEMTAVAMVAPPPPMVKALSAAHQAFCRRHSVLLVRNLSRIRRLRERYMDQVQQKQQEQQHQQRLSMASSNTGTKRTGANKEEEQHLASLMDPSVSRKAADKNDFCRVRVKITVVSYKQTFKRKHYWYCFGSGSAYDGCLDPNPHSVCGFGSRRS